MEGRAVAPAAGTILNALATETGSAFAIDVETVATVELSDRDGVAGTVAGAPEADPGLIERCVSLVTAAYGDGQGGTVRTESAVPMAAGLKSSSAAANAAVLATLDALDAEGQVSRLEAARLGVTAARDVGVTATGAFDDASASMLGGVTVTDNAADELRSHETVDWSVLVWTPPGQAFSADADRERCRRVAPVADHVADLALDGDYQLAMTVNGLAFTAALGFSSDPLIEVMDEVGGVSLSGTGPSVTAVGDRPALESVRPRWAAREGSTFLTTTRSEGATVG